MSGQDCLLFGDDTEINSKCWLLNSGILISKLEAGLFQIVC